jgi:hypothetical protein
VQSPYGPTYTTESADTFATVAAAYGVSAEAAQAQFASVAPSGMFPANLTLDQSSMLYTTGSADTFATLAGFFATDPGSVGVAALDVAGLVPAGTTVGTYQVQTGDKLRDIATRSGIAAATIALDLAHAGTALSPNVPVHCFSGLNPIAPRLFGKALVERYQAGSGNTSRQLLAWFAVSAATLGEAVAPMPGILCVGATVTNTANDKQYTIVAGDTFASLTGPLGAPDVGTLLPTLEVVTGAGLLQPGVALALGRVSRTPSAQDSLTADGHTLDGTYNVRLLCQYALELATPSPNGDGAGAAIVELLPVFYVPLWGLSVDGTLTAFATTAAAQVTEWLGRENLTAGKADAYVLDLSLFASGDAQMVRPLVELSGLTIATN